MAGFVQQNQCIVKAMVKTELEVSPAVMAPVQARTPTHSCRPTPRIVRPWEDAPSPPLSSPPATPQSTTVRPRSSSPPSSSNSPVNTPTYSSNTCGSSPIYQSSSLGSTPSSSHRSTPSCPNTSPGTPHDVSCSQLVLQQHVVFLRAISRLQVKVSPTDTWLATLASCYLTEVLRLEGDRSQALSCSTPELHATVHRHYDAERLALLQQANSSLMGYSCTLAAAASSSSSRAAGIHQLHTKTTPTTPTTMPRRMSSHSLDRSYSSGSGASSPESTPTPPPCASRLERIAAHLEVSSCPSTTPASSKRLLSPLAVRHLEEWYHQHQEHPYADAAQARQLATDGGITTAQVRKWLANRRLRHHRNGSSSTASYKKHGRARRTLVNFQ